MRNFNHSQLQPGELVLIKQAIFWRKIDRYYYPPPPPIEPGVAIIALIIKRDDWARLEVQYVNNNINSKLMSFVVGQWGYNTWRYSELFKYELSDIEDIL